MTAQLLAVAFRDEVTLGSLIIAILIGIPGVIVLLFGAKWRAASLVADETAKVNAEGREAYKLRAERLGAEKDSLQGEVGRLNGLVSELEKRPQYQDVLRFLEQMDAAASERTKQAMAELIEIEEKAEARTAGAFASHERRAQDRHEAEMAMAEEILKRLKGDTG